ncbi:sensor histidine kinase [Flindersiella endophytica]
MRRHLEALWARLCRPVGKDAGLAGVLLIATLALKEAGVGPVQVMAGPNGEPIGDPVPEAFVLWWAAVFICIATVLLRRRWPVTMLVFAVLATLVHMALAADPAPADLAVPILLYTLATRWPRKASLWVLGGTLAVALVWSIYVTNDGRADAWFSRGGTKIDVVVDKDRPVPPPRPEPQPFPEMLLGPTSWGGIPILGSALVAGWAIGSSVRSRRAYLDELRARARDLERERDQQAALAAAAERSRITRELHDVVAHGLAVIVMQAQGGVAAFERRPADTLSALHTIVDTGRASLADMRQVLATVGPVDGSTHPVPGLERLAQLIEQVRRAGTPVLLHIEGPPGVLPTSVDVTAYRIVQEALTNTMKHAGPGACAQARITYSSHCLIIDVTDNGVGDGPPADGVGNGLRGMRERVGLLGGDFRAYRGHNGGFVVQAKLPTPQEHPG